MQNPDWADCKTYCTRMKPMKETHLFAQRSRKRREANTGLAVLHHHFLKRIGRSVLLETEHTGVGLRAVKGVRVLVK